MANEVRIDLILIIYTAICVMMICFNTVFLLYLRYRDFIFKDKREKIRQAIKDQIELVSKNEEIDKQKQQYLYRNFTKIRFLKAFHEIVKEQAAVDYESTFTYLKLCKPLFEYLIIEFDNKENSKKGYLAFLVGEFKLCDETVYDFIVSAMISYTTNKSVYVRQNALHALYTSDNGEAILTAMLRMQEMKIKHNNKLISDGLMLFHGDRARLASLLWKEYSRFDVSTRVAIINFIRMSTLDYSEKFLKLLKDEHSHKEIRLAIIRYFGRMTYAPAGQYLVELLRQKNAEWEYRAIAATSLASYKNDETVNALKEALTSDNWYVRFNASESLVELDVEYVDLVDIYNGPDRYAREILEYKMETERLKRKTRKEKRDVY
ncbi:MAG TPA: HEAT repeat domain-containing protein [Clostridia bacterium]|jgi:hypothetical protein|nr:HEAT repeat domain-containing protein [Clostridiaceae bacterium]HOM33803.1 HEAT repeat domain-containing protein [Clostridia bacterium]HOT69877.1 HEAT repeat domain-containing protein [Clostridia bacterium]HQF99537.1 HEAT repeat domain-containing protein [Clostridia bacterium]HQH64669.1 HEAT repeat domain-containing protein [Clostridia bacterium]